MKLLQLIALIALLGACQGGPSSAENRSAELRVATSANAQFAMKELAEQFEQQSGIELKPVVSSSGKLTAQITEGAPYDLLLSANMKYPKALIESGAAQGAVKVYAEGALVLWSMNVTDLDKEPALLRSDTIRKIAVANPKNAPYGLQAMRYLEHYGLAEPLRHKLVFGESIAQTNQYILSGAADLGITAKSVVRSPEMEGKGQWVELPPESYDPIRQGVVITAYGNRRHPAACQQFFDFLSSELAQSVFKKYGYSAPRSPAE